MSKISKRPASEDREEGEASDGVDPSPSRESRDYRLQVAGKAPARSRDPIQKVKDNSRAERTVKARAKGVEEWIEMGKRESPEKIEDQNTQIKERDKKFNKEEKQIKRLTDQLAPRQRIYCLQVNAVISVQHR